MTTANTTTWRSLTLTRDEDGAYRTAPTCTTPCRVYEAEDDDDGNPRWYASIAPGDYHDECSAPTPDLALDRALAASVARTESSISAMQRHLSALRALEGKP